MPINFLQQTFCCPDDGLGKNYISGFKYSEEGISSYMGRCFLHKPKGVVLLIFMTFFINNQ